MCHSYHSEVTLTSYGWQASNETSAPEAASCDLFGSESPGNLSLSVVPPAGNQSQFPVASLKDLIVETNCNAIPCAEDQSADPRTRRSTQIDSDPGIQPRARLPKKADPFQSPSK